jgi:outer membrane protein assembly factor BamD (BamD/ComL family)
VPHDVFISYSSLDKTAAFAACATFEAAHIRCWIAPRDVAAGAEWAEEIIDAIEAAKIMVLIFSTSSNDSRQVKREIELAVSRGLTIMPIRLDQVEPTRSMAYYMAGVHWIDALTLPLETHFKKMVEWIKPHLDTPASEPSPSTPGEMPRVGLPIVPDLKPEQDTLAGLFRLGADYGRRGKREQAIPPYRRLIARFGADDLPAVREQVIRALFNIGQLLSELGRYEQAIAEFDAALQRAEGHEEEGIRETVARIMFAKAQAHDRMGQWVEAVTAYNWLFERYNDDVDGVGRELCAKGMLLKAHMKMGMGEEDMAILDYELFLAFYGDAADQSAGTAEAMFNIGVAHADKGRPKEAVAAYDEMLARFSGTTDPAIAAFTAKAQHSRDEQRQAVGAN